MRLPRLTIWIASTVLAAGVHGASLAQETPEDALMEAKSRYAHALLDALVREDFGAMRDQALRLKAVAGTADWKASESAAYVRLSDAFVAATNDLAGAARAGDGNAAALAYMDLTMKCVQCHRLLRSDERP